MPRLALHSLATDDFDLSTILLSPHKCWNYRHVSQCLETFLYNCFCEHMLYFLLNKYLGVELLRKRARICYNLYFIF